MTACRPVVKVVVTEMIAAFSMMLIDGPRRISLDAVRRSSSTRLLIESSSAVYFSASEIDPPLGNVLSAVSSLVNDFVIFAVAVLIGVRSRSTRGAGAAIALLSRQSTGRRERRMSNE